MSDQPANRLGAAVAAAWWTILILGAWLAVGWGVWLAIMNGRPEWLLKLWGGGSLTWDDVQMLVLKVFAAFKFMLFVFVAAALWLTLYARRLRPNRGQR